MWYAQRKELSYIAKRGFWADNGPRKSLGFGEVDAVNVPMKWLEPFPAPNPELE
jgi:hypothetical protein